MVGTDDFGINVPVLFYGESKLEGTEGGGKVVDRFIGI